MKTALMLLGLGLCLHAQESTLEKIEREVSTIVEKARKHVVAVTANFQAEVDRVPVAESLTFAGIVYTADGYIVTDASGLENAKDISVQLADGKKLAARFVGSDRRTGVAVVKVNAEGLTPAVLAEGKDLKQGIYAIVVGNPFGMKASSSVGLGGRSKSAGGATRTWCR